MNKKIFVRAEEGKSPGISVVYYDSDGNMTIRYYEKMERKVRLLGEIITLEI